MKGLSNFRKGQRYEQACSRFFATVGLPVKLVGGSGDQGVDFIAWWTLSNERGSQNPIRVFGQCKALRLAVAPVHMREFQGTLVQMQQSLPFLLGVFCSTNGFSTQAQALAKHLDAPPMLLLHLGLSSDEKVILHSCQASTSALPLANEPVKEMSRWIGKPSLATISRKQE